VIEIGSHSQPQGTSHSVTQVDSTKTVMATSHPVIDMVWPSRGTRHSSSQVVSPQEGGVGGPPPENIYGTKEYFKAICLHSTLGNKRGCTWETARNSNQIKTFISVWCIIYW